MLKLFLPVLFPSWRFFSSIGPSPRIHYALLQAENEEPNHWLEFRPKPNNISLKKKLWQLLHNPRWNEQVYINTCAEKLFEGYSEIREQEIMRRMLAAINSQEIYVSPDNKYVVYRITAVMREGCEVTQQVTFVSKPGQIKGGIL